MTLNLLHSRDRLWRSAAALQRRDEAAAPARYRMLAAGESEPVWGLGDVLAAPEWAVWPEHRRACLVLLTGGVGVARIWRSTIDGPVLRRAAEALGDHMLERLLALPTAALPCLPQHPAETGERGALLDLGASLLLAGLTDHPQLTHRLVRILPGAPLPYPDPSQARLCIAAALDLMTELGSMS